MTSPLAVRCRRGAIALIIALACSAVRAQAPSSGPVTVDSNGVAAVGSARVDPHARTVTVTGWVNQVFGAIELLACGPGGKTHESLLVLDVNPVDLQTGLLLLGLKAGPAASGLGQGPPQGAPVELWVDWTQDGAARSCRAESLVFNVESKEVLPETPWTFTGSVVEEGEFKALAEQSLVATYWDPWAIINLPLPCGSNDEILVVNTNAVPAIRTPIRFRIRAGKMEGGS
jgi:hypothetical protein